MAILLSDSYKVINWDLNTKSLDTKYWGKVTDSGRGCKVALLQNGVLKTPSTETMRVNFKKPSGLQIFLDGVISGNYFVFDFTEQVFAEQGEVMTELMLNVGGEWLMSSTFYIQVDQSFTSAIESSEELTALQTALTVVDEVKNDIIALENPVYTEAVALANLVSGELLTVALGKIKKFFSFIGTTTLTTTAKTITTAINELNTNLSRNFLNNSKNLKQAKMDYGQPFVTFTAGVATITLSQSYADSIVVANILGAIVSNSGVTGTTMTISGTTVAGVALSGQYYVKYHVIGY